MIRGIIRTLRSSVRPPPRFYSIGPGSVLGRPRLLEGKEHIAIGADCLIRDGAWLGAFPHFFPEPDNSFPRIIIEDDVYLGFSSFITAVRRVRIGRGTVISNDFHASDHTHGFDPRKGSPRRQEIVFKGGVEIGNECFLGVRVSIMPGVTLGNHCVVGAHSVVTRSFPDFSMVAGVPARLIRTFDFCKGQWEYV